VERRQGRGDPGPEGETQEAATPAAAAKRSPPSGATAQRTPRRIEDLPRALRPREKLRARGPRALSHAELLGELLGGAGRNELVHPAALGLLRRHGLSGLAGLSAREWSEQEELGCARAARLCAAFELGRRAFGGADRPARPHVSGPRQAFRWVKHLARAKKEHLVGLYLDAQNGLLRRETISIGSLNTTRTHPREILFPAVVHLALGFILAHNHPSGCLEPSTEDLEFTHGVRRAGELMGIELYDHLIVGRDGYTSLRERGVL
jgi:DNA repair protein RadC